MKRPELVCPAGTPAALRTAVEAGADAVYCGFQNATNARNFPGLNFTPEEMQASVAHAHGHGTKVLLAVNTFPTAGRFNLWREAVDMGARFGVDAFIVADIGVADYVKRTYPDIRLHLSVQAAASSPEAIRYYAREFGVKRVVLPRILTVPEIKQLAREIPCEIETFIFGNHGLMVEGRCSLTNYVTGLSTNMDGVCSPAADVHYDKQADGSVTTRLADFTIDSFAPDEQAGYPTICKGRYNAPNRPDAYYAFEEPISLNLSALLPALIEAGVDAFKIEGRQRSRAYVKSAVSAFRKAVDSILAGQEPELADLIALTEGQKQTEGAFKTKKWR
ncbi:ubiquinone anaerobic biosynthesis protein UbiU [Phaeovulum sp.]|uniref:ubiquinone anaerobic biosynthesis protein UbiU n=1 Tax=Phaeovulum sp. TaxID=2934796 RepID=UPI002730D16B|nr:peptidase U32 family protein [Phaeovulum sp.]MDP1669878.1 peptidase U32 family protein [Phaeovulum sp.]MDZ4118590.1 peptidase U32 family protein [Phaeovulum sp.]